MKKTKLGFTLIEVLMSVAVLFILSVVVFGVFRSFDEKQALSQDTSRVTSVIERARQLTLFSRDSSQYGVHFQADKVVLFKGTAYATSSPDNVETLLNNKVIISVISLNGGVSDLVFKRLSGETDEYGTITLQNILDTSKTEIITIDKTGLVK